jgi:hypothetical protein
MLPLYISELDTEMQISILNKRPVYWSAAKNTASDAELWGNALE